MLPGQTRNDVPSQFSASAGPAAKSTFPLA